jgi:hypothetical protein
VAAYKLQVRTSGGPRQRGLHRVHTAMVKTHPASATG